MRSGSLESQVPGARRRLMRAPRRDRGRRGAIAPDRAFRDGPGKWLDAGQGLASPGDGTASSRLLPRSALSPPGEPIGATVADLTTAAGSIPRGIARADIPRAAPRDPSAHSSSSILLQGASRDSRSKRSRSATYWQSVAQIGFQVADALEYATSRASCTATSSRRTCSWIPRHGLGNRLRLAKADDQQNLTHTGDILGTIRYMPPELSRGSTTPGRCVLARPDALRAAGLPPGLRSEGPGQSDPPGDARGSAAALEGARRDPPRP